MSGMDAYSAVLSRFDRTQTTGWGMKARCPAHDDRTASLSIRLSPEGHLWLKCHAGCEFADIVRSIGVQPTECFAKDSNMTSPVQPREVAAYDYRDEQGTLLYQTVRYEPKDFRQRRPKPGGGWLYGLEGVRRVLYRLPAIVSEPYRLVVVTEGEKNADRLTQEGFLATCSPMGAGKWQKEYSESLSGRPVVVIPDNDGPGYGHARAVHRSVSMSASKAVLLQPTVLGEKQDIFNWFEAGHTADEFKRLCRDAFKSSVDEVIRLALALEKTSRILAAQQIMGSLID